MHLLQYLFHSYFVVNFYYGQKFAVEQNSLTFKNLIRYYRDAHATRAVKIYYNFATIAENP